MYLYTWKSGLSAAKGDKVSISEVTQCLSGSPLDRLISKDQTVIYFNDCLQTASKLVPADRKSRTYITLAATAGMRLLNVTNSSQTERVLNFVRDHFSKGEFLYKTSDQVKIISGLEEGLYAWISANYFMDKFSTKTNPVSTYGILDLGGASTQIAFVPSNLPDSTSNTSDYYGGTRIYGVNYQTYSYSFLCWGVNQINLIYHTYLIIKNNYADTLESSCYHSGTFVNVSKSSILNSNCANGNLFSYSGGIDLNKINQKSFYIINGKSDPVKCAEEVAALFPDSTCSYGSGACSFNNAYLPKLTNENKIIAFTNYYLKVTNTELLSGKKLIKDIEEYKAQTKRLCALNYQELVTINNSTSAPIADEFLRSTCFFNYYVLNIFSKYRINSFDNVEILTKINNNTIGWPLGYLINQLNRDDFLPYEAPPRKLQPEFFIPAIIISSVLTFIALVALLICFFKL